MMIIRTVIKKKKVAFAFIFLDIGRINFNYLSQWAISQYVGWCGKVQSCGLLSRLASFWCTWELVWTVQGDVQCPLGWVEGLGCACFKINKYGFYSFWVVKKEKVSIVCFLIKGRRIAVFFSLRIKLSIFYLKLNFSDI